MVQLHQLLKYVKILHRGVNMNDLFKLDELTQYCTPDKNNMSYSEISKLEESLWNEYLNINSIVPWITTGWD